MKNYLSAPKSAFSGILVLLALTLMPAALSGQINFGQSQLDYNGFTINGVTSMQYGPDGRLYIAEYPGNIKIATINKVAANQYEIADLEVLTGVKSIVNHDDDGGPCSGTANDCTSRETTGLTVGGTAANPVIYVSSSDFRIGAGTGGGNGDVDLDTNSGIITRMTFNGTDWDVVDLVRGLPRSEENHATNGLELVNISGTNYLLVAQGGHTNGGSPSVNFVLTGEYALAAAILALDLDQLNALPVQTDGDGRDYIYDLPTLDDPTRPNVNGITDPDTPGYDGVDVGDPWGGNDGLNQAILEASGPVQMFSPGFRNSYDLVVTESGAVYVTDNGPNGGWGGLPENEGTASVTNNYVPGEPGSNSPAPDGEFINNEDHLELITTDIQNYTFNSYYGGHPNPTRANPTGAGIYTAPDPSSTTGAVWRTLTYDPDMSRANSTNDPNIALPANWDLVAPAANPVEGDYRGPGIANPEGPVDELVTIWPTNTNGIDEYTASNFGGALQGNLLASSNTGTVRRVELDGSGQLQTLTVNFFSGLTNSQALGITCNSDTDPFPGTVWIGNLAGTIFVFEPSDAVNCIDPSDPGYDPNADYDADGYTNQDEEDNGTDPCNGGSQPSDFDEGAGAPFVSDLNDPDDDADGIADADDPFQLGDPATGGSDAFTLPISNGLFNDQQGLGGIFGLGMTGLMNNGDTGANWLDWLDRVDDPNDPNPNDVLGGAPGLMTSHMTAGTANGAANNQDKGYQYGVQVDQTTGQFTVSGRMVNFDGALQLYGNTAAVGGELGYFIGDGTQSNFIKLVLTTDGVLASQEINDAVVGTPLQATIPVGSRPSAEFFFYFIVDPATGEVELEYAIEQGPRVSLGSITAQGSILTALQQSTQDLAVGFIGTSNTSGVELEGTWDFLNVKSNVPVVAVAFEDLTRIINSLDEDIALEDFFDDDTGPENLTYTVESNTNPAIGAQITGSTLTISYPGTPQTSTLTIRATDGEGNFVEQSFTVTVTDGPIVLYRVNAGGPALAAIDGDIDWEADTVANPSQYLSQIGTNTVREFGVTSYTPEVNLATTPEEIYDAERYDGQQGSPNMTYSFPVSPAGLYEVRIYVGNGFENTSNPGERIYDITLEGTVYPLTSNIDLSGTYGHQVGTVLTHVIPVDDGFLDITFLHDIIENPLVNGIEILDVADDDAPLYVFPIEDQLSFIGEQLNGSLGVQALGGDGNFSYAASGLPPGLSIEPTNGQIGGTVQAGAESGSPYSVSITVDDSDGSPADAVTINFQWEIIKTTNWRINAGGEEVAATDDGTDWRFNAASGAFSGGIYSVNTGIALESGLDFDQRDASIPAYIDEAVFEALFAEERYDAPTGPEMEFQVPLENGDYELKIYVGNFFNGTDEVGDRIFDINVEGALVADNFDPVAAFGHLSGGALSFPVSVSDGVMNIEFIHQMENPVLNAIEIISVDTGNPVLTLDAIADQSDDPGTAISLTASASGGDPGESITYYISGQPDGLDIDPATGEISGTISSQASIGGPDNNGVHQVTVTATKPGSAPASQNFTWTISQSWIEKNENQSYTARHENSFVQAGDKFYLMGGRESAQTIDIYDYTTDTWASLAGSAPFEFNHFQAVTYQGLIWVIGAFQTNAYPNEIPAEFIWMFDPADQVWIQGPQIPVGRRRGSAGLVLYNDKFYVVGGNTDGHDGGFVPWFDEFDPATGQWTPLGNAPRARDHFHAVQIGNSLYVSGGRQSDAGSGNVFEPTIPEVDVYNFTSGTWSTLPAGQNIPTQRAGAATVNYNGRLLVIGGETGSSTAALDVTEEYDPQSATWRTLGPLNNPRHGTQAIVSGNGIFIAAGSPLRGGGNQKNMEYLGVDAPVGSPSVASTLETPGGIQIADGTTESFDITLSGGNVGVYVTSMVLSGPNAADFAITAGELNQQLLKANSTYSVSVELTGTGPNRSATLTINYGDGQSQEVVLSNDNLAPDVTNPGNQFNNEGDNVSLQIEASDASENLAYSASNLPPNLTINPSTGLITGILATGTGSVFQEESGLVVIEAESANIVPDWTTTTAGGSVGVIAGSNYFNNQNGGTLVYEISISTPGVSRFNWRNFFSGSNPTEENDNWLRFPNSGGVWFFGYKGTPASEAALIAELEGAQNNIVFPVGSGRESAGTIPEGASSNGFLKIYRAGGTSQVYDWQAKTSDNDAHDVYVRFENAGTYTMEVSERSAGHAIDRMALYKVDGPAYSDSQLTNAPESNITTGNGAAENSPYSVQVTVTDDGNPALDTTVDFQWIVGDGTNEAPVAVAEATPVSGQAPLDVQFTGDNSTDDSAIVAYAWDFKDGETSIEANPLHTFTDPGTYVVELTVTDDEGFEGTDTVTITVNAVTNQPPTAVAAATPLSGTAPLEVIFDGSASSDDVGIVSYFWDFQDGTTSDLEVVEHTFTAAGDYDVTLTVTDSQGEEDTDTITISVTGNTAPVAVAEATPLSGDAPLVVNFTGSNSTDDGTIVTYAWDFQDGGTSDLADPQYTFNTPGEYIVSLTVTDDGGLTGTDTVTITVTDPNQAPVAVAEATPTSGVAPLAVNFTGSNSTDDGTIVTYAWDFQDGGTSSEADPQYTFNTAGNYDVTLTVTDDGGLTDTDTITIVVSDPSGNEPPVALAEATPVSGTVPLEVAFTGSNSTDDGTIVTYAWDFQDGGTSDQADPVYTFNTPGEYVVSLTVTDDEGLTDTDTILIEVFSSDEDPIVDAGEDVTLTLPDNSVVLAGTASDPDGGDIVSYQWVFDGPGTPTLSGADTAELTVSDLVEGTYIFTLTVIDDDGQTASDSVVVTVLSGTGNPVAVAEATPESGTAPLDVAFTGSNSTDDGTIVSYSWDFGDGNTSDVADPQHTYTNPGTYQVSLTVTDDSGLTDTATLTIVVSEEEASMVVSVLNPAVVYGGNGVKSAVIQVLNMPEGTELLGIRIFDYSGRLMSSYLAMDYTFSPIEFAVPVDGLSSGIYFIQLEFTQGDNVGLKLMVD